MHLLKIIFEHLFAKYLTYQILDSTVVDHSLITLLTRSDSDPRMVFSPGPSVHTTTQDNTCCFSVRKVEVW